MLSLTVVIICAIGFGLWLCISFGLWLWYEMTHAIEIDIDGNVISDGKKNQFDKEHDDAVAFRSSKC